MDPLTQLQLTRELVDIDSTTPHEIAAGEFLDGTLRRLGYDVVRQPVQDGRFNLVATTGRRCVPPAGRASTRKPSIPCCVARSTTRPRIGMSRMTITFLHPRSGLPVRQPADGGGAVRLGLGWAASEVVPIVGG